MIANIFLVALGGFLGAMARYRLTYALTKNFSGTFPHATLFVNGLGSFILGVMLGLQVSTTLNVLLAIGFLGSFTTFSTINAELVRFKNEKNWVFFTNYIVLTYLFGIVIAFAGFMTSSLMIELQMHLQLISFMLK